jgi:hypothetical protein
MAPRSSYRKEGDFQKLLGPYLGGDSEVSTQMLAQPLERERRLIAAFLGAVGRAGSAFAKEHVRRFAPDEIEALAKIDRGFTQSLDYVSWKKYRELFQDHSTEPAIENKMQEIIVKTIEVLVLGRTAGPG